MFVGADEGLCGTLIDRWNRSPPQRAAWAAMSLKDWIASLVWRLRIAESIALWGVGSGHFAGAIVCRETACGQPPKPTSQNREPVLNEAEEWGTRFCDSFQTRATEPVGTPFNLSCVIHSYFSETVNFSPVFLNIEQVIQWSYNDRRSAKRLNRVRYCSSKARKGSGKLGQ